MATRRRGQPWQHGVAGVGAGMCATVITHPLDMVKTRFQVQDGGAFTKRAPVYTGTVQAFRHISRTEGLLGLYRGLTANVLGNMSAWGSYLLIYNAIKQRALANSGSDKLAAHQHLVAASQAGVFVCLITNPVWVVKTRMQLTVAPGMQPIGLTSHRYAGVVDAWRSILRTEGIRGLYKGLVPALFGVSHGALQFMAYEELKHVSGHDQRQRAPGEFLAIGAASKVFASSVTYPYQVIRSRMQDEIVPKQQGSATSHAVRSPPQQLRYRGVLMSIRNVYQNEGLRGFYRGIVPNVLRVTPSAAITFFMYEAILDVLVPSASP